MKQITIDMTALDNLMEQAVELPKKDRYELNKFLTHSLIDSKIKSVQRTHAMRQIRRALKQEYSF